MKRILTAVVAVPILIFIVGFTPPLYFAILVAASAALALEEFFFLAKNTGIETYRIGGHFFSLLVIGAFYLFPRDESLVFFILSLSGLLFLVLGLRRGDRLNQVLPGSAATLLALIYIATTLGLLVAVRSIASAHSQGGQWILSFLLIVWFGDTGAYYVGRNLGKHKLAPLISPKKTIEGSLGGLLGNTLAAVLAKGIFVPSAPILPLLLLSWVIGVVSQVGDLVESALKRGAGVKDSSGLLPGHGGMLDRIDGVLLAAPILFCYIRYCL